MSSAASGAAVGSCVGLGYVRSPDNAVVTTDWVREGSYTVNVGGDVYPITLSLKAIYDPGNERIRQ